MPRVKRGVTARANHKKVLEQAKGYYGRRKNVFRVATRRGWVVLASDASHYYANMEQGRPYPIIYNVGDMVDGWRRAHALAESPGHVIPGHDPLVLERYPAPEATLKGSVARLD